MGLDYINTKYKPKPKDLVCEFYMEPNGMSFEEAANNVALESSIGTWTTISTMNKYVATKLKPSVFYLNKKTGIIKIAYHQELFEEGNMSGIMSSIAGNIFGMKAVKNLRLLDIHFTKKQVLSFEGPAFGIPGIRKMVNVKKRPLVGTIVKPKVGLTEKQHAKVAYDSWVGGLDVVKDDENLTSLPFNNFYKRMDETFKMLRKAEKETGERKIYMPNITSEVDEMIRRAKYVKKKGGTHMMIDILTVGWSALHKMRKLNLGLAIHAHRAGHGAFTRNKKHGISMMIVAKAARLLGCDQLHIGTAGVGKMHGSKSAELAFEHDIEYQKIDEDRRNHVLNQKWYGIKPVFAVASGGMDPTHTADVIKIMGKDIIIQYGGGCHGHPDGTRAGAAAIRQSVEAYMKGIPLKRYAKTHRELARAFEKWG